jgi:hypothetical protein
MDSDDKQDRVDRRRHKMFVTRNSEYHMRDDICVGVRNTREDRWLDRSRLLSARLMGAVDSFSTLSSSACTEPAIGKYLLFICENGELIVTTRLEAIDRPPMDAVQYYLPSEADREDSSQVILPQGI